MARALIVGCGCRGRLLGESLAAGGWAVRGTSRSSRGGGPIEAAGIEAAVADPDRPGTILDQVGDVSVLVHVLGSAVGGDAALEAIHGPRLERLLEKLVDSPVRGFVYEAAGDAGAARLGEGRRVVERAAERWRIPVGFIDADPADGHEAWLEAARSAVDRCLAP